MTPQEIVAHFDDRDNARTMCELLERTHPGWTVWRADHVWHARYETWPEGRKISNANAGMLNLAMRLGGILP